MRITTEHVIRFLEAVAAEVKAQRAYLTELDSPIGDADHGINLDRGFTAVLAKLPMVADKDIGTILKTTGMTLVSTVGGASGPLYGTAFLRAGMALADRYELNEDDVAVALEAALEGIMTRGKAQRGEKTMIDALAPAVDALKAARAGGADLATALQAAAVAAEEGMRATIPMLATKGRASYLGERSIGHQDPGATSAALMLRVMRDLVTASASDGAA
ncbi:dihydroxyacetone kinase subunit DhaL [Kallotenue papyrolyticum]|uniref:dihydroxyacetone kinase subunit DhaL n=1 Tax=Kallotenue papyrolyticum TaxID=1325125 RepID=UPI0004785FA6|nr:dihydroxyacetone kinase subunit DhaL [Kallotenue papyrolyticum]